MFDQRPPNNFTCRYLEPTKAAKLNEILKRHNIVFSKSDEDIGKITIAKHKILTVPHHPIQMRHYRRPQHEYDETNRQVQTLVKSKKVRPSISPYASPTTLVRKKDGTYRLCMDFRRLNAITIDDKQPLPLIHEVLDRLKGAKYFTTLDMAAGYWHIEMDEESIEKTAFVTNEGHYEWLVMPFGLKNAPATFQRIIQRILGPLLYNGAINYLDDIIIYSETYDEHMKLLNDVLTLLVRANIKLKLSKCYFAKTEVNYLGHTVSQNAVKPSKEKTKAIDEFPIPDTLRKVRSFLGLSQYYRRFISNFTRIAKPLTLLTRKNQPFIWGTEQQRAFDSLKDKLTKPPVLAIFDPTKPCKLYTDASKDGIGATLTQISDDDEEHVIEYFSRRLDIHQQNYSASELECLAVVEAIEHFEVYLSLPFTVITDHSALQWLLNFKKPKGKLYRWSVRLSVYTFKTIHKAGRQQQHVDALSRSPVVMFAVNRKQNTETEICQHLSTEELILEQQNSDMSFVRKPIIRNGITTIYHNKLHKAVVPESLKLKVLKTFHEQYSHPGKNKTVHLISRHYWWPNIIKDIKRHVQSCKTCQLTKHSTQPTPGSYVKPNPMLQPLDIIGLDTIVMGPSANNTAAKNIQVFIDHHSRYIWAYPTKTNTSQTIQTIIQNLLSSGLKPKRILTDCHLSFKSKIFNKFLSNNGIKHTFSTPYHPQTNGIVERANGTIISKVRAALLDYPTRKWSTVLKDVVNDYNRTPHDITGYTPQFLLLGIDTSPEFSTPEVAVDEARLVAQQRTAKQMEKRRQRHNAKHSSLEFDIGDRVTRTVPDNHPSQTKTTPRRTGPYFIIHRIGENTYDISDTLSGETTRAHVSQMRLFHPRDET